MNTLGPMKSRLLQPVTSVELENMQLSAKRVKTRQVTTVFTSDWLKNSEHTSQNHLTMLQNSENAKPKNVNDDYCWPTYQGSYMLYHCYNFCANKNFYLGLRVRFA